MLYHLVPEEDWAGAKGSTYYPRTYEQVSNGPVLQYTCHLAGHGFCCGQTWPLSGHWQQVRGEMRPYRL